MDGLIKQGNEPTVVVRYDITRDRFCLVSEDGRRRLELPVDIRLDYLTTGLGLKQGCTEA